jgi:hypothetical protein
MVKAMTNTGLAIAITAANPIAEGIHPRINIIPGEITLKTVDIIIKASARF